MEPVPAKKIVRYTTLEITCGKCGQIFWEPQKEETATCNACFSPNNLATTWNERKDNE